MRVLFLSVFLGLAVTLGCNCATAPSRPEQEATYMLDRAVKVEVEFATKEEPGTSGPGLKLHAMSGSGVVFYSSSQQSLVMTAHHVCTPLKDDNSTPLDFLMRMLHVRRTEGPGVPAAVLWADQKQDVCVLAVDGYLGPAVPVASELPQLGALVYWAAAPLGVFGNGVGFLEQGHYAGHTTVNGVERELIAGITAHGASGSGLFYRGRLIGIIIATLQESGYIVAATSLDTVQNAVEIGLARVRQDAGTQ